MTRQEFIIDTLKPYLLDSSLCAVKNGQCKYRTGDGRMCAVGKHIKEYQDRFDNGYFLLDQVLAVPDVLTPEAAAQNLHGYQWGSIQAVHDRIGLEDLSKIVAVEINRVERLCEVDLTELKELLK